MNAALELDVSTVRLLSTSKCPVVTGMKSKCCTLSLEKKPFDLRKPTVYKFYCVANEQVIYSDMFFVDSAVVSNENSFTIAP